MKKSVITLSALSIVFALGLGLVAVKNSTQSVNNVSAEPHTANFDPYTYSGSYYNDIDASKLSEGLSGTLRTELTSLIYPDGWYTYGGSGSNTLSTQLQYADEDPTNHSNMIYLYTRNSVRKNAASSWNREHVWCQSLSNNCWGTGKAGTDILHIRPTYNTTNSTRNNHKYGDTNNGTAKYYEGMLYGYLEGDTWEPLPAVKGDVARIVMYIWVAYKNAYSNLPNVTNVFENYDTMLKCHMEDKPDVSEGNRNDYSEVSKQKNRNPFVDHPEYAWMIFGDSCSATVKQQCMEIYPADGSASKTMTSISLSGEPNKKEYDAGEIFNPEGLTVTGHYNDNSTRNIPLENCTWTPNPLIAGATTVVCTYNGFNAVYTGITVTDNYHDHTFSSDYAYDETYHWHEATCGHDVIDGKALHEFENVITRPTEETGGYTTHTCKVCGYSYQDSETQPLTLVRIQAKDNKSGVGYQVGEELDLEVTAVYNDNSTAIVTNYTVEGFNNRKPGKQYVTVSYRGYSALVPIEVFGEVDPEEPEQPEKETKRGCSGSITATLSLTSVSALIGIAFVFVKRRK